MGHKLKLKNVYIFCAKLHFLFLFSRIVEVNIFDRCIVILYWWYPRLYKIFSQDPVAVTCIFCNGGALARAGGPDTDDTAAGLVLPVLASPANPT